MSKYDLTERLETVGMKQAKLVEMIETTYGEHVDPTYFTRVKRGQTTGPKADRVLAWASQLLAERERLLGISNAYTKEA